MKNDFFNFIENVNKKSSQEVAQSFTVLQKFLSGSIKRGVSEAFNQMISEKKISTTKVKKLNNKEGGQIINGKGDLQINFYINLFKLDNADIIKENILKTIYKDLKFSEEDKKLYESDEKNKSQLLNLEDSKKNLTAKRRAFYYVCGYFGDETKDLNADEALTKFIKMDNVNTSKDTKKEKVKKEVKKKECDLKEAKDESLELKDYKHKVEVLNKEKERIQKELDESNKKLSAIEEKKTKEDEKHQIEIKKLNDLIKELTEKVNCFKKLDQTEAETKVVTNKISRSSVESKTEIETSFKRIDKQIVSDTFQDFPIFGTVEPINIVPDKKEGTFIVWIKPVNPLVPNFSYIEREEFYDEFQIIDGLTYFALFVSNRNIKNYCVNKETIANFEYMSEDEQKDVLIDIFCKKAILFVPEIKYRETENDYVYNALVLNVNDYNDFCQSIPIPIIKEFGSKKIKEFISQGKNISFKNLPITLFNSVPYVIIDEVLYSTDLIPQTESSDISMWKPREKTFERIGDLNLDDKEKFLVSDEDNIVYANLSNIVRARKVETNTEDIKETKFIEDFINLAKKNNLCYTDEDLKNFHISLKSSQLVILAGPSGIGKTRLPLLYSKMLNIDEDKGNLLFVNINPSLNEPSDLLGYLKPILENESDKETKFDGTYMESSSGLVSFLKAANDKKDRLHIVIFDEMNLAQIEYWFAPFISILERDVGDRKLNLYAPNLKLTNADKYPSSISIGENVIFIGTINIDETTKEISDRVFDRALVLKLHKKTFSSFFNTKNDNLGTTNDYKITYSLFNSFRKNSPKYINVFKEEEIKFLDEIHELINSISSDKGVSFRNLKTISNYLANSNDIFPRKDAFDYAINQTIIQKIRGADFEVKELFEESGERSLITILDKFTSVSDFKETRESIAKKRNELGIYGFTK